MKTYITILFLLIFLAGCVSDEMTMAEMQERAMEEQRMIEEKTKEIASDSIDWKNIELTDVLTGNQFKISDFEGKPILLESFAVWCPTCKKQQDKIKDLHKEVGDDVISISLDTDPNEKVNQVIGHANRYNFDWIFAVSPVEVTKALIDEFSIQVVNAPGAPVVLICEDQSARMLARGVKSADKLKEEIEKGC
jgi:thiol-disulfide isomerase/thioredoxin